MAELTPEEKEKIYLEEKARLEAREKLKSQQVISPFGIGVLLIFAVVVVFYVVSSFTSSPTKPSVSVEQTQAGQYAHTVRANLNTTTLEQFMGQMPDIQADITRDGDKRTFSWTFSDGSKIVATFVPRGGQTGLVLYSVQTKVK
ncbi:MAG: hypothetical protein JW704_13270 [Anaerolineaceae bacterium]|nr:hypothetical protein [Anaerolineaceae bacterium]